MPDETPRVRVDTGFRAGDAVSPFYDPMLAKLIVWGDDREHARCELLRALSQCEVAGVTTNVAFLERVVAHRAFASGAVDTGLIDAHRDELLPPVVRAPRHALIAAAAAEYRALVDTASAGAAVSSDPHSPWHLADAWWNGTATHHVAFTFDDGGQRHVIAVRADAEGSLVLTGDGITAVVRVEDRAGRLWIEPAGTGAQRDVTQHERGYAATVVRDGDLRHVFASAARARLTRIDPLAHAGEADELAGHLAAPMSGTVVAVMVKPGDRVDKGAPLVVLEAMKMEHTITAPAAGRVVSVHFAVGDRVAEGADLVDLEDPAPSDQRAQPESAAGDDR